MLKTLQQFIQSYSKNRFFSFCRLVKCLLFHLQLLEDVVVLLDSLAVWDVQAGTGWQEMVHLGLSVILSFAQHEKLEV